MTIATELLDLVERTSLRLVVPPVRSFELPPPEPVDPARPDAQPWRICNNFAALVLADGTVGMTYTALDDALAGLLRELPSIELAGRSALEIAGLYAQPAGWQRSLGLAAINAISQCAMRHDATPMQPSPDTLEMLAIAPGDRIGMVGLFGRLVEPIRATGASLTVIELDPKHVRREPGLVVTLDATQLRACNKVLITGTTLLNGSLDGLLELTRDADRVCLIDLASTASCLPGPLFARGLTAIGGTRIESIDRFLSLWSGAGRWREATMRYVIERRVWRPDVG
ncbi:MAG: DUF364 domain-containing protein [Burkholderiaceae bacterium]